MPPGALSQDAPLTISSASYRDESERRAQSAALAARGAQPSSEAVAFGPDGLAFAAPATVVLPYAGAGAPRLYAWDRARSAWTPLPASVDPAARTVSAQVASLGVFQVQAAPGSPAGSSGFRAAPRDDPSAAYAGWDLAVTPDPVTTAATFQVRSGALDAVELRVYGGGGRLVYKTTNFAPAVSLGGMTTYSAVWDASGAPDGVYAYLVTVRKAGRMDAVKTGRVRVAR